MRNILQMLKTNDFLKQKFFNSAGPHGTTPFKKIPKLYFFMDF